MQVELLRLLYEYVSMKRIYEGDMSNAKRITASRLILWLMYLLFGLTFGPLVVIALLSVAVWTCSAFDWCPWY